MSWIALILALTGAYLITLKNRKWHFRAFCMWTYTNAYWAIYNFGDWAICIQFSIFFFLALLGLKNTYKEVRSGKEVQGL